MAALIEFTMHAKPGHYEELLEVYSAFAEEFQHVVPDDRMIVIAGDAASGLVRGLGMFDVDEIADDVNSMPFFAEFNDRVAPLLASPPERLHLDIVHVFIADPA